ncbi:efflux RND transporter periplasmic adaptor subunit [Rhodoligotrophos defluvii]|uniref:efflux RND transporter periplasmic adaptor subunit n=1 Tax=Rhodoligotrophos defluvii TaxID=2561934 RepID=UPI0010C99F00|nr:efflux RND transporter periplasmic adaptor subunit [Rhodoligotrophos defluvii]
MLKPPEHFRPAQDRLSGRARIEPRSYRERLPKGFFRVAAMLLVACSGTGLLAGWYLVPTSVDAHVVHQRMMGLEMTGPGLLDAINRVTITARIQGFLTAINADRNDRVTTGQVLATLESTDLENELAAAKATAESTLRAVAEAESTRDRASISFDKAKRDYDRRLPLLKSKTVSEAEFSVVEAAYKEAEADLVRAGTSVQRAQAEAAAAAANVKVLEARLAEATIRSPLNGVVVFRERNVGDLLMPGAALMQIVDPATIIVSARFDESAMGGIKPGQDARVTFASEPGRTFEGKVLRLSRQVDQETREFTVDITLKELPRNWAMGQRTHVTVLGASTTTAIAVPQNYITRRDNRAGVWVDRDGRAVWTPVTLGYLSGTDVQITHGLSEGDAVLDPEGRYPYEPVSPSRKTQ